MKPPFIEKSSKDGSLHFSFTNSLPGQSDPDQVCIFMMLVNRRQQFASIVLNTQYSCHNQLKTESLNSPSILKEKRVSLCKRRETLSRSENFFVYWYD
jgi:hypothetical protein